MPLLEVKGDILAALRNKEIDLMAHGVNCMGGFGSGIAAQIAEQFPEVKRKYLDKYTKDDWVLGEIQAVKLPEGIIVNCATQEEYGAQNRKYCSYDAIEDAMKNVRDLAEKKKAKVGIPKIGCGLAGGNWNVVRTIIKEVFKNSKVDVTIYHWE